MKAGTRAIDQVGTLKAKVMRLTVMLERAERALKPFADYADKHAGISPGFIISKGSLMARRQLTMGDCYGAANLLRDLRWSIARNKENAG